MSKFATGFLGKNPQWKFGFPSIFLALRFDLEFEKEIWECGLSTTFPQQINSQESGQKNCKSAPASAWRASGCLYGREINPPTASPPPGQNKMTTQVI
jgi:hypothetical protein